MRLKNLFLVALIAATGLTGCVRLAKRPPAAVAVERYVPERAKGTTLRAVSFNILYAGNKKFPWQNRRESAIACLRDMNPDVFGVQEAEWIQLLDILDVIPGYTCVGRGRDDGHVAGEFMGLFYRTDRFVLKQAEVFWLSETPDAPGSKSWNSACVRCATVVILIDRTDGTTVGICDTHLDHISAEARANGAQVIRERLPRYGKDVAWVVTGDFNTAPGSAPHVALLDPKVNELRLTDSFAKVHPDAPRDTGSFHGYTGKVGVTRIDWILCGPEFEPLAAGINNHKYRGAYPTDHFPVWADLKRNK